MAKPKPTTKPAKKPAPKVAKAAPKVAKPAPKAAKAAPKVAKVPPKKASGVQVPAKPTHVSSSSLPGAVVPFALEVMAVNGAVTVYTEGTVDLAISPPEWCAATVQRTTPRDDSARVIDHHGFRRRGSDVQSDVQGRSHR